MLPLNQVEVRDYVDQSGTRPFTKWFDALGVKAAAKVATAVTRLSLGNYSNVKGVGAGVFEYKIDFGPGYRIYFAKEGESLIILLGGGVKKRQRQDIQKAIANWMDYKRRK